MSEFHKAFYVNCPVHKEIEHPIWRKCPKCSEVITYSEEEFRILARKCWNAADDYREELDRINAGRSNFDKPRSPNFKQWFETNKKKI